MPLDILGYYGIDQVAHVYNGLLDGSLSLGVFGASLDSNAWNAGKGDTNGVSFGFEKQGVYKIASAPTIGAFINNGSNRTAWRDEAQASVPANRQGAYASATAGLYPWLPIGTNIQAVADNEPGYAPPAPAGNFGGTNVRIPSVPTDGAAQGHSPQEKMRFYSPYVKGPGQGTRTWAVRGEAGTPFYNNYIGPTAVDHAAGSPSEFSFDIGYMGEIAAGAVSATHTGLQIMPFGTNLTPTGECLVFSDFLTYPDRSNGYFFCPGTVQGGIGIQAKAAGWAELNDEYIKAWIRCCAQGLEGRDGYLELLIREGLNNRSAPNDTKAVFRAGLDTIIDRWDSLFAGLQAAGTIGSNVKGTVVRSDVVGFRIPTSPESLDHCYEASREKAVARGLMVVGDHRNFITATEAARISTDGSHLTSQANYERTNVESTSRLFLAARKAANLRRLT